MAGALDGIRMIDFGPWLAGPLTALLLADQGAEVIHVAPPSGPFWKTTANATLQTVRGLVGAPLAAQLEVCFCAKPASAWVRLLGEAGIGAHTLSKVTQLMQAP